MVASFSSAEDPMTKRPINWNISGSQFVKIEDETAAKALFKKAAKEEIAKTGNVNEKIRLSIDYQVLCGETSLVGVIKQKNKASGELMNYEEAFGKKKIAAPEPAPVPVPVIQDNFRNAKKSPQGAMFKSLGSSASSYNGGQ